MSTSGEAVTNSAQSQKPCSDWQLAIPEDFRGHLSRAWLLTAVGALLVSGLFVILIVASRTPGIERLFPLQNFFHLAIVVHVDFSVLVWFAAFGAMLWSLVCQPSARRSAWLALGLALLGSILLAASPFRPGQAIMSNYIPVLENHLFMAGLGLLGGGVLLSALHSLFNPLPGSVLPAETGVMRFGVQTGVIALVLSLGLFVWSLLALPPWMSGSLYYETLFWGGGHTLQFAWVQFMLVAWLWLAGAAGIRLPIGPRLVLTLFLVGVLPAFLAIWGFLNFEVGSPGHRNFFIWLMAAGGGLAAGPLGIAILIGLWRSPRSADRRSNALRYALLFSVMLFALGGLLGFMIRDSNTIIPAHYHGCIVAITLAFMALALHLLPAFGYRPANQRLMLAMPWVYGSGQLLHVIGLAFSGGHGVQRKTAGAAQGLESLAQISGMVVMGLGGLVAIIGGVLFLIAFGRSVLAGRNPAVMASEGPQHV